MDANQAARCPRDTQDRAGAQYMPATILTSLPIPSIESKLIIYRALQVGKKEVIIFFPTYIR